MVFVRVGCVKHQKERESPASCYWLGCESIGSGESPPIDDGETAISSLPLDAGFQMEQGKEKMVEVPLCLGVLSFGRWNPEWGTRNG